MIERRHQGEGAPAGLSFRAELVDEGRATVLRVAGELDIATRAQMDDALARACGEADGRLTVDLSGLRFIDASGLDLLAAAHNRLLGDGRGGLVVQGASGIVRRVFEITQLASLLDEPPPD